MIKIVFCLRRRPELSPEQFRAYWREQHAPLVARHAATLGIRRYVQSHTLDPQTYAALAGSRGGAEPFDGVAELWFDSLADMAASDAARRSAGRELLADEERFIDLPRSPIFLVEEHEIVGF